MALNPGAPQYKKKIREILEENHFLPRENVITELDDGDWIVQDYENGGWSVAEGENNRGRPDDSIPFGKISHATLEQAISTIRNEVKQGQ